MLKGLKDKLLVFGFTPEEMDELQNGKAFSISLDGLGMNGMEALFFHRRNDEEMKAFLKENGLIKDESTVKDVRE